MTAVPPGYPSAWETQALLKDGATVTVRPIRPDDGPRLVRFHSRQSKESIYFRFFRYRPELSDREVEYFTNVDYEQRMAFIALVGDEMVAVSRYESEGAEPGQAEVAFFVDDAHHGRGLATLMLEYLAARARSEGITTFTATVLPENYRMLGVFKHAGFDVSTRFEDGAIAVTIGINDPSVARETIADREQEARRRAVARFFEPRSVAVIGAGRSPSSVGHQILVSIAEGGFTGSLWAVNPSARTSIAGVSTVAAIDDIDDSVDLAVIAVNADDVAAIVEACGRAGVEAVVIVSAGYGEAGEAGKLRLAELVSTVRTSGLRMVGPSSYGLINTDPQVSLAAHFLPVEVAAGRVALLSQSGPLGGALLNRFASAAIGISSFISAGMRADVSVHDLLQFWESDDRTDAVVLYLENLGNPRNFMRVGRRISLRKPVVTVEPAHTDLAAVARASGFVLVDRVSDLSDQARLFSTQPLPEGPNVAVVSNARSLATLIRSACQRSGLTIVTPHRTGNDGDGDAIVIDDADSIEIEQSTDAAAIEHAVVTAAVADNVHSIILALVPTIRLSAADVKRIAHDVDRAVAKPVVAVDLVSPEHGGGADDEPPTYAFPEQAAAGIARMAEYSRWRAATEADPLPNDRSCADIEAAVHAHLGAADNVEIDLSEPAGQALFETLGIPVAQAIRSESVRALRSAAERFGFPVALKAAWTPDRRAGETGGTLLDVQDSAHLEKAFERMGGGPGRPMIVQPMHPTGPHLRLRLDQSLATGSHLRAGVGGLGRKGLGTISQLVVPATESELDRLVEQVSEAIEWDVGPEVRSICATLSRIAGCTPDVAVIELNPVLLGPESVVVVDGSVELTRMPEDPLAGVRTL